MNILIWFWRSSKWNLSNFWDQFHGCRLIITTGLKMVWRPMNCYQGVSKTWTIWSKKKIWKKITESHSRVAQVSWGWRQSCSSCKSWRGKIHPFFFDKCSLQISKIKMQFFFHFLSIFFLKLYFEIRSLWENLRATFRGLSTVSVCDKKAWAPGVCVVIHLE